MPIALNGNYYTANELAEEIGIKYGALARRIANRDGIISIGPTYLIPEALGKLVIQEINYTEFKNTTAITMLAHKLGIQPHSLKAIIAFGLPTLTFSGKKRLSNACVPALTQAVKEIVDENQLFPSDQAYTCYLRTMELMEQSRND